MFTDRITDEDSGCAVLFGVCVCVCVCEGGGGHFIFSCAWTGFQTTHIPRQ